MKHSLEKEIQGFFKILYSDKPSQNALEYWISHFSDIQYPQHTSKGGKWLIFCSSEEIDETWKKIKEAQDKGLLGDSSKSATKINAERYNGSYVICVYTYNSEDMEDVLRIREGLKSIGFDSPLKYKRDIETRNHVYGSENEFLLTI